MKFRLVNGVVVTEEAPVKKVVVPVVAAPVVPPVTNAEKANAIVDDLTDDAAPGIANTIEEPVGIMALDEKPVVPQKGILATMRDRLNEAKMAHPATVETPVVVRKRGRPRGGRSAK